MISAQNMSAPERDAAIVAAARSGTPTSELAEQYGLKVNRVQQIVRVAKLRERHGATMQPSSAA